MATKKPKRNKSAMKRVRQAKNLEVKNRAVKSTIKTFIKRIETAIAKNNKEEVQKILPLVIKLLHMAASRGILHKNTVDRKISRLTRKANTILFSASSV